MFQRTQIIFEWLIDLIFFVVPGKPTIKETVVSFSKITFAWLEPVINVGPITKYKVCWRSKYGINCTEKKNSRLPFTIEFLTPGTEYNISVSAFTTIGEGPADSVKIVTTKSSKWGDMLIPTCIFFVASVSSTILLRIFPGQIVKIRSFLWDTMQIIHDLLAMCHHG